MRGTIQGRVSTAGKSTKLREADLFDRCLRREENKAQGSEAIIIWIEMRWEQCREECQPQGRELSSGKRIYMPDAFAEKRTKLREARLFNGRQLREDCILAEL